MLQSTLPLGSWINSAILWQICFTEGVLPLEGKDRRKISVEDDASYKSIIAIWGLKKKEIPLRPAFTLLQTWTRTFSLLDLTRLLNGQSIARHRDLLLRGSNPVQHAPPALQGERKVRACSCGAFVDAQHWGAQKTSTSSRAISCKGHWPAIDWMSPLLRQNNNNISVNSQGEVSVKSADIFTTYKFVSWEVFLSWCWRLIRARERTLHGNYILLRMFKKGSPKFSVTS